jgi:hypothetical protein
VPLPAVVAFVAFVTGGEPQEWDVEALMAPPDPIEACTDKLADAGVRFREASLPLHRNRSGEFTCGAPQVVRYRGGPGRLRWSHSPKVTCALAVALARFEEIVQEEAREHLGRRVVAVRHLGAYNCREMAAYPGWISEHSYANAIDIHSFELGDGRVISVGRHWKGDDDEAQFLHDVATRLYDEDVFSGVLTPAFDDLHRGHIHLDLARYRSDGTR